MMIIRWPKRFFRLQGHAVSAERLYAVQWVLGVLGIVWALLVGVFVSCGGAEHLTGELYQPMMSTFQDYHVVGAINILGGVLGVVGLGFDIRRMSIASAILCAGWNGMLAFYTIPANWTVPGGGNIVGLYAALITIVYLLRIVLLVDDHGEQVKLR